LPRKLARLPCVRVRGVTMNFANTKDDNLLVFYESVRRQVEADANSGGRYRFLGRRGNMPNGCAKKWIGGD